MSNNDYCNFLQLNQTVDNLRFGYINNKNYNKIFDYSSVINLIKYIYDKFDIIFKNFKINEVTCYYEMVSESIYILYSIYNKKSN